MGNQYRHVFLMAFAASFVGGNLSPLQCTYAFIGGGSVRRPIDGKMNPIFHVPGGLGRIAFPKTRGVTVLGGYL